MKKQSITIFLLLISITIFFSCRENFTAPSEERIDEKVIVTHLKNITIPSQRVVWTPGKTYLIKWEITGNLDKVRIDLVKKFVKVLTIAESTENGGSFVWHIPYDLPQSHHYRIKLMPTYTTSISSISVEFEIRDTTSIPLDSK